MLIRMTLKSFAKPWKNILKADLHWKKSSGKSGSLSHLRLNDSQLNPHWALHWSNYAK